MWNWGFLRSSEVTRPEHCQTSQSCLKERAGQDSFARTRSSGLLFKGTVAFLFPALLSVVVSAIKPDSWVSERVHGGHQQSAGPGNRLAFVFRPSFSSSGKGPSQPKVKSSAYQRDSRILPSHLDPLNVATRRPGAMTGSEELHARAGKDPQSISTGKSWLLLRHGQTNFNAEGRVQVGASLQILSWTVAFSPKPAQPIGNIELLIREMAGLNGFFATLGRGCSSSHRGRTSESP